jgi:hypothetical protein
MHCMKMIAIIVSSDKRKGEREDLSALARTKGGERESHSVVWEVLEWIDDETPQRRGKNAVCPAGHRELTCMMQTQRCTCPSNPPCCCPCSCYIRYMSGTPSSYIPHIFSAKPWYIPKSPFVKLQRLRATGYPCFPIHRTSRILPTKPASADCGREAYRAKVKRLLGSLLRIITYHNISPSPPSLSSLRA